MTLLGRFREWARHGRSDRRNWALRAELARASIVEAGRDDSAGREAPFVRLKDGTVLYGRWPSDSERAMYARWCKDICPVITEDTFRVAVDVVLRYLYPHAMPYLTMPYRCRERRCFHRTHMDTIDDLRGFSTASKTKLKEFYMPRPGEVFLDVGSYMGFGTVRMSQAMGPSGTVVAVEADPNILWLLEHNIRSNGLTNVTVIPKAAWNQDGGKLTLFMGKRQANSLVAEVIDASGAADVETITVDSILEGATGGRVDRASFTINGAEVEAVEGMAETFRRQKHMRLSLTGFYERGGQRVADIIARRLRAAGFEVAVGRRGFLLAWR